MTINVKTKPYEAPATETLASGRLPIPPKPSETDPLFTPEEAKAQIELERQLDAGEITKTEYDDKIFEQSFGPRPTDPAAATQYDKQKAKIETGLDLVRNPMEALGLHKGDFADAGLRVHDSHLASLQENQAEIDAAIETGEASLPGAGKADGVEAQGATVVGNNGTGRFLKTVFRVGADVGENGKNLSERIIVTTPLEKINGVWRAVKGSQDTTSYEVKVRTVVDVPIPNSNGAAGQEIGLDGRFKFSVKRNGEGGKPQQRLDKFSVVGLHEVVLDAGAGLQAAREGAAAYIARRTRRDPPPDIEMGDPPDDPGGPDDPGDPPDVPPLVAMPIQPPTYNDFVNTVRGMNPGARQFLETLPPNRLTPEMIQARALAIERIDRLEELVDQYGDGQGDNIPERREFEEAAEQANYRLEVVGQHLQHGPGALPSGTGALTGIAVPPPPAMGAGPSSGVGPSGSGLAVRQAQIPPIPDFAIVETGVYAPFLSLDFWNADAKGTLPDGSPKPFVPGAAGWDWVPDSLQITAGAFVDLGPRVRAPGEGADTRWQIFNDFVQNKQAVVRLPFNVEAWIEAGWKVDFTDIGRQPAA